MVYTGTLLHVCDNSGVKLVKCLKVLGRKPKAFGKIGDTVVVNIQRIKIDSKFKKKEIYRGIIVRLRKKMKRIDDSFVSFGKNSIILLNNKGIPLGNRVFGPVSKDLRIKKNLKLVSLCTKMI